MSRVQRIRRDLPGRRMEISSMDKQSFSFPLCFSRHPFLFCFVFFSPPPSLICCRGFNRLLEIAVELGLGGERHWGKAHLILGRTFLGNTWEDLFGKGHRVGLLLSPVALLTCAKSSCPSGNVLCPGNAFGLSEQAGEAVLAQVFFLPGKVMALETGFNFSPLSFCW